MSIHTARPFKTCAVLPLSLLLSPHAFAQEAPAPASAGTATVTALPPVTVHATRPVLPEPADAKHLLPPAPGGQVATGSQLGILGNRDALVTPFNITAYTSKFVDDSQSRSIADVAAADPSVRLIFPRASYRDVYTIRGFNLFNYNMGMDGLYGIAPKQRYPADFAERIEILKGPDTFVNGVSLGGSVGGAINIVPKRATDSPVSTLTTSYVSRGDVGEHLDYGRRFGPGHRLGIRFNGQIDGGNQAVSGQSQRLGAAALDLDYQGDRFRLYGDFGFQQQRTDSPDWAATVANGTTVIPVPTASANLSQSWTWMKSTDSYGMVRGEYDLTRHWTAFAAYGVSYTVTDGLFVQPTNLKANGSYTGMIRTFPSNGLHESGEAGLRGQFDTGGIDHHVTLAMARWDQYLKAGGSSLGTFTSSLDSPVAITVPNLSTAVGLADIHRTAESHFSSAVLSDTVGLFSDRLLITAGGRLQKIESGNYAATTGAQTSAYDASKFSPALTAVLRVTRYLSVYGNYVEALAQGPSAPANAANYGQVFAPTVSRQVEAGIKADWGNWSSSIAAFQIMQASGITDPTTLIYSVNGQQRNQGLEFNVSGEPLRRVRVLGGVMLLNPRQTHTAGGICDGRRPIGTPQYTANLGAEWDLPMVPDLTLSARAILTGAQYVDAANTQRLPSWTRFDFGARYTFKPAGHSPIVVRLAVENAFGRNYWAAASTGQIVGISRGAPRTLLASTTFSF